MDVLAPVRRHPRLAATIAVGVGVAMGASPQLRRIVGPRLLRAAIAALAAPGVGPKLTP